MEGELDLDQMAKLACCSTYHFQRMFSYMAGVPLGEYVRRRRMTKAAFDLQSSDEKVLDLSLKYGYDSPTAFNRAFQSVHGVSPTAARQEGTSLKAYHPITFKITIRGDVEMNYRIENKGPMRIVGAKLTVENSQDSAVAFARIPQFWAETAQSGTISKLLELMDTQQPGGVLGVSVGNFETDRFFDYYIAVASTKAPTEEMDVYEIPACTWAIFECKGPMPYAIQDMSKRIMTEWFPNSGYQYANAPDIEVYGPGDQTAQDYTCWIWVPVTK